MSRSWPAHTKNVKELELGLPYFVGAGASALLDFFTKMWYIYITLSHFCQGSRRRKKENPTPVKVWDLPYQGGDTYVIFRKTYSAFAFASLAASFAAFSASRAAAFASFVATSSAYFSTAVLRSNAFTAFVSVLCAAVIATLA